MRLRVSLPSRACILAQNHTTRRVDTAVLTRFIDLAGLEE
jgi:hypothetical protein